MGVGILIGIVFVLQVHLIPDTEDNFRESEQKVVFVILRGS